jgi:hypothetical protein
MHQQIQTQLTAACFEDNPMKLLKLATTRRQQADNLDQTGMEKNEKMEKK